MFWKISLVLVLLLITTSFSFLNNAEARGADEPCSYLKKYKYQYQGMVMIGIGGGCTRGVGRAVLTFVFNPFIQHFLPLKTHFYGCTRACCTG